MKTTGLIAFLSPLVMASIATAHDSLPLGDKGVSRSPEVGHLYSCQTDFRGQQGGAQGETPWIHGSTWSPDEKPMVQGSVAWPNASITVSLEGDKRVIRANGLPRHVTGIFPIQESDPAFQYDRNPNSIRPQQILLELPATPAAASAPGCIPMGMIGFALDGVAIFNGVDAGGRDAVAHEVQDRCNGHPQPEGQYHYHGPSPCLKDPDGEAGRHSDLIGYALDGYGIYGEHGEGGRLLHDSDLDACHGHTHAVIWDGKLQVIYHYHLTPEYPYTLGCFHGRVDPLLLQQLPHPGGNGQGQPGRGGERMGGGSRGPMGLPPGGMNGESPGPGQMRGPDRQQQEEILEKAAAKLGVSADRLRQALGPPPPNFQRAAGQLGISEQTLEEAMREAGAPQGPPP